MKTETLLERASKRPVSKIRFLEEGFYVLNLENLEELFTADGVFVARGNRCSVMNGGYYEVCRGGLSSLFDKEGRLVHSGAQCYFGSPYRKKFVAQYDGRYEILNETGFSEATVSSWPEIYDTGGYSLKTPEGYCLYNAEGRKIAGPANEYIYVGKGWYTEEFKQGNSYLYHILNAEGERLYEKINGLQVADDGSYVISAHKTETLYDAGGNIKVGPCRGIELGDDGRYILHKPGNSMVFSSSGKLLTDKVSFVQFEPNGWFEIVRGNVRGLYDENLRLIHENADSYSVYGQKWFAVCYAGRCELYSPEKKRVLHGNMKIYPYNAGGWFAVEACGKHFGLCIDEYSAWKDQLAASIRRQYPLQGNQADYYLYLLLMMV